MGNKILVVDDDHALCEVLKLYLEDFGYQVDAMFHGAHLIEYLENESPDLILLDIDMPGDDGFVWCERIRMVNEEIPIIFLTSYSKEQNRVQSFKLGANDFVAKPFSLEELRLRIEVRLKDHRRLKQQTKLHFGDLVLNLQTETIMYQNNEVKLTSIEIEILNLLAIHPNKVYSEKDIFTLIWKDKYVQETRMVNVHISNLRKKLLSIDPSHKHIKTIWTKGYQFIG